MKSLLILDFVDNTLNKHNCYSCKSNITLFYYLICHIYPKNMYIFIFKIYKFIKITITKSKSNFYYI